MLFRVLRGGWVNGLKKGLSGERVEDVARDERVKEDSVTSGNFISPLSTSPYVPSSMFCSPRTKPCTEAKLTFKLSFNRKKQKPI
ncbi:hypothetical protein CDAR_118581 [Caerostris darwini]|uniref:Uncharacterized protein n=1 Tax=Caerostris darwini TaxID=1538125 RepID=A0AAV4WZI4_9ARAC|nr:hypothetical protein CDAR_118581 [Caerostris darwini]